MERMVRKWIYFEIEQIGFADRFEMGCERRKSQDNAKIFFPILFYLFFYLIFHSRQEDCSMSSFFFNF